MGTLLSLRDLATWMMRLAAGLLIPVLAFAQDTVVVGSKRFTESYILAEIATQAIIAAGEGRAVHRQGMGNTAILFAALKSGAIHLYPEYTGTIAFELLGLKRVPDLRELNDVLARHGLRASVPLGFANAYALAMREDRAAVLGISSISDLRRHPDLRPGISQEFLNRKDGWPALAAEYTLPFSHPRGLDHGLAYEALAAGQIDVMDVYSTDAKLGRYRLRVLMDDRRFFPAYDAVFLHRLDLSQRFPGAWQALRTLEGRIANDRMITMNAAAELSAVPFSKVAEAFLATTEPGSGARAEHMPRTLVQLVFGADFWRLTLEHLLLVFSALAASLAFGIPLGIWAYREPRMRHWILGGVGVLQTIPSLALLAFLIAALGRIGTVPAIVALFLYGLLPIVRNTEAGLATVAPGLRQSALALGLSGRDRVRLIELPLAMPAILAGIKTSAVINVGTATIAAFIGAGGYGERIVAGLAVNDRTLLLAGAIPAALMALFIEWGFAALERALLPPPLRSRERPTA